MSNTLKIFNASYGSRIPVLSAKELGEENKMTTEQAVQAGRFDWFEALQNADKTAGANQAVSYTYGANTRGLGERKITPEKIEWNREAVTRTKSNCPGVTVWQSAASILNSNGTENRKLRMDFANQVNWAAERHLQQLSIGAACGANGALGEAFPSAPEAIGFFVAANRCGLQAICSLEAPEGSVDLESFPIPFDELQGMIEKYVRGNIDRCKLGINCVSAKTCIQTVQNNPRGTIAAAYPNKNCFPDANREREFKVLAENQARNEEEEKRFQELRSQYTISDAEIADLIALSRSHGIIVGVCCGGTSDDIQKFTDLSKNPNSSTLPSSH